MAFDRRRPESVSRVIEMEFVLDKKFSFGISRGIEEDTFGADKIGVLRF